MTGLAKGLFAGLILTLVASFWPFGGAEWRTGDAQIADYLYEVRPGLHDGRNRTDLTLTTGWRLSSRGTTVAIDMDIVEVESNPLPVYASFRALSPDSNVKARVESVVSRGKGCREVLVSFFYGNRSQPLGEVSYLHVVPGVQVGDEVPVVAGAGKLLDSLARSPWVRLTGDDAADIIALAGNVGSRRIEGPFDVAYDGGTLSIIRIEGEWYRHSPSYAISDRSYDGGDCATTAAHLHQAVPLSTEDHVWRNVDRPGRVNDNGLGYPGGNPHSLFCSDTWVYRLQSSRTTPAASPVLPCAGRGAIQSAGSSWRCKSQLELAGPGSRFTYGL